MIIEGINPPHRIKSISMSTFSNEEVEMMRSKGEGRLCCDSVSDIVIPAGNAWCAAVWCGSYNKANNPVNLKDDEKIKEFIISKYEKKRYYVDPSQANFSSIKTQLTGGSTGSGDSHGSYKLSSSSLIGESCLRSDQGPLLTSSLLSGSTLKARVDGSSVLGSQVSQARPVPPSSSVVSRPDFLAQAQPQLAPPPLILQQQSQPQPPAQNTRSVPPPSVANIENFDNFADFDGAAFDSLPPGNLNLSFS